MASVSMSGACHLALVREVGLGSIPGAEDAASEALSAVSVLDPALFGSTCVERLFRLCQESVRGACSCPHALEALMPSMQVTSA